MRRIKHELARSDQEQEAGTGDRFSLNYVATLFPYFLHWSRVYGSIYLYSTGSIQALFVTDPDIVKELANCKSLDLGKPCYLQKELGPLLGMGILTSNGDLWVHQRKVIAPEFFMDKAKGMVNLMMEAANAMLSSWENKVESEGGSAEVVVDEFLRNFSADVISRASFGSSFAEGKEIFNKIRQLQMAMAKQNMFIGVPGSRYLPTKSNREIWNLDISIRKLVLNIAKSREHDSATPVNKDLLHSIIEGSKAGPLRSCIPEDFIVDNCKNIYFAGHETTSTTAAWCLMLLASHPKWQSSARAEVLDVCQGNPLHSDMLRKLKTLTMVIQETLRLYPPAPFVTREALNNIKVGSINIPKGTNIRIPIALGHRDPAVWGPNPDRFDPDRFSNGIAGACKPSHMYMPFGVGARTCAGQNLAMVELKVVLSLLLSKFEFALSPNYVHCPAFRLTIEPGDGVPLVLKKL
ncbi:cytochrome P450 714C2-like isoform X2 [Phragmites australis]|nr:cytochrome P450 714C2-like isoform X2 [Phragmites australis]